jgi:hypothetical protein
LISFIGKSLVEKVLEEMLYGTDLAPTRSRRGSTIVALTLAGSPGYFFSR